MIHRIKNMLPQRKLWQKLLTVYLSISVVPLILIIFVSYISTVKIANTQISARLEAITDGVSTNLLHNLSTTDNIIESVIYTDSFLCNVNSCFSSQTDFSKIKTSLQELKKRSVPLFDENINIKLFLSNGISIDSSGTLSNSDSFNESLSYFRADSSRFLTCDNNTVTIYYQIMNLYQNNSPIAVLRFEAPSEKFIGSIPVEGTDQYIFVIQNTDGETLYLKAQTDKDYGNIVLNLLKRTDNNTIRIRNEVYAYNPQFLEQFQWNISVLIPQTVLYQDFPKMLIACIIIGLICLLFVSVFSISSSLNLSKRINNIGSEVALISDGQLDGVQINIDPTDDEIGRLSSLFHQMIERINSLVIEQYKNEIKSKEEQLKILQNQINPHFLYNCMDTINWRCIMNNDQKTSKFANNLAEFYRTCLNKGNTLTSLSDEIRNIHAYIYLQLDMHDDTFRYEEDIDPEILDYECINLMLQPIVENAIGHGLEASGQMQGLIKITGQFSSPLREEIILTIYNDGEPIDPKLAANVIEGKYGYGLSNVVNRIRLYFGSLSSLTIEPTEHGTVCTIRIPARRCQK